MEAEKSSLGRIENLEYQIEGLILESRDSEFTDYLKNLKNRLCASKYQVDLLQEELDGNCKRYEERMRIQAQMPVQQEQLPQPQGQQPVQQEQLPQPQGQQPVQREPLPVRQVQPSQNNARKPAGKDNLEFIIGATILGVIGAAFILTDLVLLGMNYMNGLAKGIGLCVICIALLIFSELAVYRRLPKLGSVLSAIGIGGMYLSTVINFLVLHNFNLWTTLTVTMLITAMVVLLSRKRDSLVYRIIGMIAGYLCFFTIQEGITDIEFLVVSGMVLLMSVLCIALPLRKGCTAVNCVHMCVNTVFALAFLVRAKYCGVMNLNFVFLFLAGATMVMHLLLTVQVLYQKKCGGNNVLILVFYGISAYILSLRTAFLTRDIYYGISRAETGAYEGIIIAACMAAAVLSACGLLNFIVLAIKKCPEKWAICYYLNFVIWAVFAGTKGYLIRYEYLPEQIALVALLLISKLFCLKKIKELKASDAILTTYVCLSVCVSAARGTAGAYEAILLVVGVLFGILLLSQWKTYQEVVLTLALAVFAYQVVPSQLRLPAAAGLFFVGILLFNNVNRWKDKRILVYNILMLIGEAYCFLVLYHPVYQGAYLTYLCMLVFGLATIIVTLEDKYQMGFKGKNMILAIFLSYMSFVFRTGEPIVGSILLMVVALICVGIGFAKNQKNIRIYGLALSLLVCVKIGVYDFVEAPILQKTILFFIVGAALKNKNFSH
ncbi:MAG: hypothetical protein NC126_12025 [Clostridium sp.]|nr:hypothetical protein [Clostridium sp.]